ncbi:hypothetical protein BKA62DRAFT_829776 [Auriculariales sp. MPI-PUGE-AT-0066]|nr:hypothetical protein BKA62DRAFT_829776 [Auriculariales sp. MPI-PUGE-AT-0066]
MDFALTQQWMDEVGAAAKRTIGKFAANSSQRPTIEELEAIVLDARTIAINAIHDIASDYNASSALAILPVELFVRIARLLHEHDRRAFANACRLVRAALIADPSLWSCLSWQAAASEDIEQVLRTLEHRNIQRFAARLALAKDQPLHLQLSIPHDYASMTLERFVDALAQRSAAGPVSLLVELGYGHTLDEENGLLASLSRVPNLVSLAIEGDEGCRFDETLSMLLNGLRHVTWTIFTALRRLKVVNISLDLEYHPKAVELLDGLYELRLKSSIFTLPLLQCLLIHCKSLQTLRLADSHWQETDWNGRVDGSWMLPKGLRSVSLLRTYEDPASLTLQGFWSAISSVDEVTVLYTHQWVDHPAFVFGQPWIEHVKRLEVHARLGTVWGDEYEREIDPLCLRDICVRAVGDGGRVREVRYRHERLDTWPGKYADIDDAWDRVSFGSADLDIDEAEEREAADEDEENGDDQDMHLRWDFARLTAELDMSKVTTISCDLDRLPAIIGAGRALPSVATLELLLRTKSVNVQWPMDSTTSLTGCMDQLRQVRLVGGKRLDQTAPLYLDAEDLAAFLSRLVAHSFSWPEARLERLALSWPLRVGVDSQQMLRLVANLLDQVS